MPHDWLKGLRIFEADGDVCSRFPELMLMWQAHCPDVNIKNELAWAHDWCKRNPRRAPKKDRVRFLINWMRNAQRFIDERKGDDRRQGERRAPAGPPPPDYTHIKDDEIMSGEDFRRMRETIKRASYKGLI